MMNPEEHAVRDEMDPSSTDTVPKPASEQKAWMPLGIMFIVGVALVWAVVAAFQALFIVLPQEGGLRFLVSLVPLAVLLAFAYSIKRRWAVAWFAMNLGALVFIGSSIYSFAMEFSSSAPDSLIGEAIWLTLKLLGGVVMILYLLSEKPVEWFGLDPKWSRL